MKPLGRAFRSPICSPFHGGNTGSNPVGDASLINKLSTKMTSLHPPCRGCVMGTSRSRGPELYEIPGKKNGVGDCSKPRDCMLYIRTAYGPQPQFEHHDISCPPQARP